MSIMIDYDEVMAQLEEFRNPEWKQMTDVGIAWVEGLMAGIDYAELLLRNRREAFEADIRREMILKEIKRHSTLIEEANNEQS